ncbi:uncharacterized protein LOC129783002 [Falco peregrinus]|uniref:uncharacterized protein LOC129783002 n=1 Tax=Falco peregrinus TaxID=8954 RepID=UPI00247ACAC3|nr:uncharacterized protein LOC129783002 [Falco peregrinus]
MLLTDILAKREASVSTKKLHELCRWANEKGHLKDLQLMFSVTEWREIGDSLCDAILSGSKLAKDLGTTWREVMNHLRSMVVEKKMAMAASDLLGWETESESTRLFGLGAPSAKGIIVPIKKSATELLQPTPSPEGAAAMGAPRRPESYREPPPLLDEDEGTRVGPSTHLNESAESDKENEPTPAAPAPIPHPRTKPSNRTLNHLQQQLNKCHLPTAGRDLQILTQESVFLHPAAPQSHRSGVIRDAILEREWQAASAVACPVRTTSLPDGSAAAAWKPFDWKFMQQLRQAVTPYGLQSEPAKHLLNYLFDSEIMTPSDCTSLARLLLTPVRFPVPRQHAVPYPAAPPARPPTHRHGSPQLLAKSGVQSSV